MGLNSADLLRMLEPAVRPVDAAVPPPPRHVPIEDQSFESLLLEARSAAEVGGEVGAAEPPKMDPLSPLAEMSSIQSVSLRGLIAGRRGST